MPFHVEPSGSRFEQWLTSTARSAGWSVDQPATRQQIAFLARLALEDCYGPEDWEQIAQSLKVDVDAFVAAYTPEMRRRRLDGMRRDPVMADLEAHLDDAARD
ncbi:hypothetical protein ABT160_31890 [Streptomyces sp. NPDC001941]|uniref:hypothetical protein n=1 Tax=Streptomyces sp. NPDC001941 TaxID=3154659 RepID=UPI00331BAAA1